MTGPAGIVLAAGESRRMGRPKALLPWQGSTFVATVAARLLEAGCDPVIVVIGAHAEAIRATALPPGVTLVENADWPAGQAGSLRAGVAALPPGTSSAVIALVDQPHVDAALVRRLVAAHAASGAPVVRPVFDGRGGHPLLIDARVFPRILTAPSDATTFTMLQFFRDAFCDVPFENDSIRIDFDTPDDLARDAPRFGEHF